MDLRLEGRTAFLGARLDGALAACARLLAEEGATVAQTPQGSDIVIGAGCRRPGSDLLDIADAEDLFAGWADVTEAVEAYRAALPRMTQRGWGRLVWIGSAQARSVDGEHDEVAAVVSLGMLGLHKVLTAEAGRRGVTANAVLRGGPATDDDIAAAVAFLCSDGAGYLSGITVTVDGGAGSAVF